MGRSLEKSGRTVNDAIAAALSELELTLDDVHVDVLNEGKSGLFGLLSGKPARVRISELDENERADQQRFAGAPVNGTAGLDDGIDERDDAAGAYQDDDEYEEQDENDGSDPDGELDGGEPGDESGDSEESALEYDIDRAMEYLDKIFNGIDISAEMEAESSEDGFLINIESEDSGILIGHRGETLDAIQYLVNLYMNKGRSNYIRVSVDIENYKKKREAALTKMAGQTADKVVRLRRNFTLDPMNSYERRIIHFALQNHPKVETYSVGEEPNRKVVVTLKNRGGYQPR